MAEDSLVIHKIFSNTASRFPDKVALQINKGDRWQGLTYKNLETQALKVATFLLKEGLKKGDFAALILENRPEWPAIYLGIMYAGMSCVPIDLQLTPQELKNLITDSAAEVIFCSYNIFMEKLKQASRNCLPRIVVIDSPDSQREDFISFSKIEDILPEPAMMPDVSREDIASLIYTSGTTAVPKGVLLTHKNICSNFRSVAELNICFSNDNILSILPLHHTYAFMVTLIVPLFLGAQVTYNLSLKSQDIIKTVKETRVTVLVGVPQLFSPLYKAIFERMKKIPSLLCPLIFPFIKPKVHKQLGETLRLLVSGGARLDPKITRYLTRLGFKLIEGYGLTETSPVATLNPPLKAKPGSVGKPIPGVEIKISHPDKSGVGEVLIKGSNVMQGYFKQPALSAQAIREGWFYSGDLGYLDKEGYLYLAGREKEIIVLGSGKNIYPEELEEYYSQIPYIKEICILAKQEERFGQTTESLYAIVVPNLEYFRQKNEADMHGKIRWELENFSRELPSYKHIMGFTLTKEELPRTALKKIKRYQVRNKYLTEKMPQAEIKEIAIAKEELKDLNQDLAIKIIRYISQQIKKTASLDSHLEIDLGIDSLSKVELFLGLETLFAIKIPDEMQRDASTVRDIIKNISDISERPTARIYKAGEIEKSWAQILRDTPSKEMLFEKITMQTGFLDKLISRLFKSIFLFIFRIFWRLRIERKGTLSPRGPYIICPNHASYLDGFILLSSLPLGNITDTFFLGYSQIFEHPLVKWSNKISRLIPVDSNAHLSEAMQAVALALAHKKIVCIFPEGRRSIDDNIGEFKKGVGILIKELDIPAVPVYIKGSHLSWPRGQRLPRFCPLKIIFGRPHSAKELLEQARKTEGARDDYEAIASALREEVFKLAC